MGKSKNKTNDWVDDYIIAVCSSEVDSIKLNRFRGTESEAKELLIRLAAKDRKSDEEGFDFGAESVDDVDTDDIDLSVCAVYSSYHITYTAKKFCDLQWN